LTSMRWMYFYSVPKVKFAVWSASYASYMIYASFVLLKFGTEGEVTGNEVFFWVWAVIREMGEFYELDEYSLAGLRLYARDFWNQLDQCTFLFIMAAAISRLMRCSIHLGEEDSLDGELRACEGRDDMWVGDTTDYVPRILYSLAALMIFFRVLQLLVYQQTVGVLAITLGAMRDDVVYFSVILFVLTFGFGVTFAVLLPQSMSEPWYQVLGNNPLWGPFWGVFGGFDVSGPLELEPHEPTTTLTPILLWIYQFTATILLVNLLIAQMADTYGRVTADGLIRWQFQRAALIGEFKDAKPPLPPPLSFLCLLYYFVLWLLDKAGGGASGEEAPVVAGFKKVPANMDLRILERRERAALDECLRQRAKRYEESAEAKAEGLDRTLAKLEKDNRARFENMNVRFENINGKLDANTTALEMIRDHVMGGQEESMAFNVGGSS